MLGGKSVGTVVLSAVLLDVVSEVFRTGGFKSNHAIDLDSIERICTLTATNFALIFIALSMQFSFGAENLSITIRRDGAAELGQNPKSVVSKTRPV